MEEYMVRTRTDHGAWVVRDNVVVEIKSHIRKELRETPFSGKDDEDANEHIEKVLVISDMFNLS